MLPALTFFAAVSTGLIGVLVYELKLIRSLLTEIVVELQHRTHQGQ